jgi:hypothetical protein
MKFLDKDGNIINDKVGVVLSSSDSFTVAKLNIPDMIGLFTGDSITKVLMLEIDCLKLEELKEVIGGSIKNLEDLSLSEINESPNDHMRM